MKNTLKVSKHLLDRMVQLGNGPKEKNGLVRVIWMTEAAGPAIAVESCDKFGRPNGGVFSFHNLSDVIFV